VEVVGLPRGELWKLVAVLAICWAIASTSLMAYYYLQAQQPRSESAFGRALLIIDYGNGTTQLYNLTFNPPTTLLNLTVAVANVETRTFEGVEGTFVEAINGVRNDWTSNKYWMWWVWSEEGWVEGPVAADLYTVESGVYCWSYSSCEPPSYKPTKPNVQFFTVDLRGSAG